MTDEQGDLVSNFIKQYWLIGTILVCLASLSFGVGEKIATMQGSIDAHEIEIKSIQITQQQAAISLQAIQVQLAQNAQQLSDIKAQTAH